MDLSVHILFSALYVVRNIIYVRCQEYSNPLVEEHMNHGRLLLSQGNYGDALSHYHAAVEADPYDYLTYYTRATVYLAMGKIASAIKDLSSVIELKPDFISARVQRANMLLRQGKLDEAHIDYENALRLDPMNVEAHQGYTAIEPLKRDLQLSYSLKADQNYIDAINTISRVLQEMPWDVKLREMRAECYEAIGDIVSAISDFRTILKAQTDQLRYLRLSQLYYQVGETEEALNAIRECLRYDPDHKGCFTYYKHIKKVAGHLKAIQNFINEEKYEDCVERAESGSLIETKVPEIIFLFQTKLCQCYNKVGNPTKAVTACSLALRHKSDDIITLCERGDAYVTLENYSEAISDYQKAVQINEGSRRANEGLRTAHKLEKQAKKKNYYSILGVKRTANKKEIIKAYRKLAQKWHPDNFSGDQKAEAEKKFIDIAAAKEVLTDPEKRKRFDRGEDPLDPESSQSNPFQGFNPFERGSPFTFKFHFS